jgi:hypothetical protein
MPPPPGDGWFLAYVPTAPEGHKTRPWIIATRGVRGFYDCEGYPVEPEGWLPLPDPQPAGSGWLSFDGHIELDKVTLRDGRPMWTALFVRADGVIDGDRSGGELYPNAEDAEECIAELAREMGIPFKGPAQAEAGSGKVLPFHRPRQARWPATPGGDNER